MNEFLEKEIKRVSEQPIELVVEEGKSRGNGLDDKSRTRSGGDGGAKSGGGFLSKFFGGGESEQPSGEAVRHSLTKCACEKCQDKRKALAVKFGIAVDSQDDGQTLVDAETIGKVLTAYHSYRFASLASGKTPQAAAAWEVSAKTEEAMGKLGAKLLDGYMRKANFKYKDEVVLLLYISSDIGVRFAHESRLLAEGKAKT